MFENFYLTISDNQRSYTLNFDVYKYNIAQKWAFEISQNYDLHERTRFKSWNWIPQKENELVSNLNLQIDIINEHYCDIIDIKVKKGTTQHKLNCLHKYFEMLRGNIDKGTEEFNSAPSRVQKAIEGLNIYIHEYEDFIRSRPSPQFPNHPFASIVGTFSNRPRYRLQDEDYDFFTFNWKFGEVYINYCEVGKPILDVFKDNDTITGKENIRPLHYYSADFMIKFGPNTPYSYFKNREKQLKFWLKKQGIEYSKYLSIGLIPVAKLKSMQDKPKEIVKKYSKCNFIEKVSVE